MDAKKHTPRSYEKAAIHERLLALPAAGLDDVIGFGCGWFGR